MSVNKNVLLVCSPYYQQITDNLIKGAIKVLKSKSVNYNFLYVPGALEIAPAIKLIYEKSSSLHCPLVIINGNLEDKEIEKII